MIACACSPNYLELLRFRENKLNIESVVKIEKIYPFQNMYGFARHVFHAFLERVPSESGVARLAVAHLVILRVAVP